MFKNLLKVAGFVIDIIKGIKKAKGKIKDAETQEELEKILDNKSDNSK
jgi:hypothetical protein